MIQIATKTMDRDNQRLAFKASQEVELASTTPYGYGLIIAGLQKLEVDQQGNPEIYEDIRTLVEHLEHHTNERDEHISSLALDRVADMEETPSVTPWGEDDAE